MTGKSEVSEIARAEHGARGARSQLASRLIPRLAAGRLVVELPSGARIERAGAMPGPDVSICVHRFRAFLRLALGGEVGFAGSYVDGDWSTPDLVRFFELIVLNETAVSPSRLFSLPSQLLARLRHGARRNTKRGSRRNIAEHYDLGNDFYRYWLDEGMTYSAALFAADETLEEAQQNKIERVADLLLLQGGERVLEIGCGWGALAEYLVRNRECHVTGVTLSQEQFDFARARLGPELDAGEADIRLQDYRDVEGRFDRIVSIEMFEAVGEAYWEAYFDALKQRLSSDGTAVLQVITIAEERFETYRRSPDFIQCYIFPGGMLPTKSHLHQLAAKGGMTITSEMSFGEGYGRTLAEWRTRFRDAWPHLQQMGFDERFRRMWDFYLAYCEVGFNVKATDVTLLQLRHVEQTNLRPKT